MPSPDVIDPAQLPGWESLPADVRQTFIDVRLPGSFLKRGEDDADFVVGPDLKLIDVPPVGRLVRFGRRLGGFSGDFCVNPATGEVLLAAEGIPPNFVNSTLDLLARTIEIASGFERVVTTGDEEEVWAAGQDFLDLVHQIDPPAAAGGSYWEGFASDVQTGDYSDNSDFSGPYD